MSRPLLAIPHRTEEFSGGCLPACCQMALAFFGIARSQKQIAMQIGHIEGAGTPARNVTRLSVFGVGVQYIESGTLNNLREGVEVGAAIIVFVRTGELPYWDKDTPHALVIVGIETDIIYANDPAFEDAPIAIAIGDFMLAWDEFGNQYAIVRREPRGQ